MRQINIEEALPGMVLARSILSSEGKVLLSNGVKLSQEYINRLMKKNIPVIFVKDARWEGVEFPEYISQETQQRALAVLSKTVRDLSVKNYFSKDVVVSIASDIVEELLLLQDVTINLTGIMTHDDYTFSHSLNCAIYAALLARCSGFNVTEMKEIACGALLHDVGKKMIDASILNKPDRLTQEEYEIVKAHAVNGFNILRNRRWEISSLIAHMAWQHHEKVDGTGYPRGLMGPDMLNYARILAIADVYEAISVHRPYRAAMAPEQVYAIMSAGIGTHFDSEYGNEFLSKVAIYTPGMKIILNTKETALVVATAPQSPKKPRIRLLTYADGSPYNPPKEIELSEHPEMHIVVAIK